MWKCGNIHSTLFISRACQAKQIPKPKTQNGRRTTTTTQPQPLPLGSTRYRLRRWRREPLIITFTTTDSQTLTTQSQSQTSKSKSSSPPLIPGPAGELQSAMHHRRRTQEELVPTQEFIRRVVENPHRHDDHDFSTNPWLCALDFLSHQGFRFY